MKKKWKGTTKNELLSEALVYVSKYLKNDDADISLVAAYLIELSNWATAPETQDSGGNPSGPPPPPPSGPGTP